MEPLAESTSPVGDDPARVQDRRLRVEEVLRRLSAELQADDRDGPGPRPTGADAAEH